MSAAAVVPHPITILPPGPIREELTSEFFDKGQRGATRFPVHAEYDGEGFTSTGLAWEDYSRMQMQHRKQSAGHRLPTPVWALNQKLLRSVLVRYLEKRAGMKKPQPGTEYERMQRALAAIEKRRPMSECVLKRMCSAYLQLKKSGCDAARLNKLSQEIENHDTVLRLNTNVAGTVLRIVHLYYSVGMDSVAVALELGFKPPHVRQVLWRLRREYERMNGINRAPSPKPKRARIDQIALMAEQGISYTVIGKKFEMSRAIIYQHLKKAGLWKPRVILTKPTVPRIPRQKGRAPYLEHQQFSADRAVGLYLTGKSVPEIALEFGYAPRTGNNRVRTALVKAGIYKPAVTSLMSITSRLR